MKEIKHGITLGGFSIGDWVKDSDGPEGEIEAFLVTVKIKTPDNGNNTVFYSDISELAHAERPKPKLTPEQAWAELPILVAELIKEKSWPQQFSRDNKRAIFESDRTEIRHQSYILLGGAGIKVTEEVKERVRNVIERMATVLGVRYL